MVTMMDAVRLSGISSGAAFRMMDKGLVHFIESYDGPVLICPATLLSQHKE